jgi:hypothetical protein
LALTVLVILARVAVFGQSQCNPCAGFWIVDGPVHAILLLNDTVYVGGEFAYAGPRTGSVSQFDLSSGAFVRGFPSANGTVNAVEPDGAGGWFLGGQFTSVAGVTRTNVAHVRADSTLDRAWDAGVVGTAVHALILHEGRLYIGGNYTRIGGTTQRYLAVVNAANGSLLPWNPALDGTVNRAMVIANGLIYVGGQFSRVGSVSRGNLAAIDLATAAVTDWNPDADQAVYALQVDGESIYVGGRFTSVGSKPRNRLAELDANTGAASNWNPNPNDYVYALAVTDTAVYVGGEFTTIAVQNRRSFAAVHRSSGTALPLNFEIEGDTLVNTIRIVGDTIYVGGNFVRAQGARSPLIAAASLSTGEPVAVPQGTPYNGAQSDASVRAIGSSADRLLVAGNFRSLGGVVRANTAAFSAGTGEALPWTVLASDPVRALASWSDIVYVAGEFTNVNNVPMPGLAAVDPTSGELREDWAFSATYGTSGRPIIRSLLATEDRLFLGGQFSQIGDMTVRHLAAVDPITGHPLEFNADLRGGSQGVKALALGEDTLYVAGDFNNIAGTSHSGLAAVNSSNAQLVDWEPAPQGGQVITLARAGDRLYVGGPFTQMAGIALRNLAVFQLPGHMLLPWDASLPTSSRGINAISALETAVYLAGDYNSVGGEFRQFAAALGPYTAQAFEWDPAPSHPPTVVATSDRFICLGGPFRTLGKAPNTEAIGYFAAFSRAPVINLCGMIDGRMFLETTTGDLSCAVIETSPDLVTWSCLATNDASGYAWTFEQPISAETEAFFRVSAR